MSSPGVRSFHEEFKKARLVANLTQDQLAEKARVSRRTIIRWESGQARPWIPELKSVLQALELSEDAGVAIIILLDTNRAQIAADRATVERQSSLFRMGRARKGLKPVQLAKSLNRDVSTIARWESGQNRPNQAEAELLCQLLGIHSYELAEFSALGNVPDPLGDEDLEERIWAFGWPWNKDTYQLFDVRFLSLIHHLGGNQPPESGRQWRCSARIAYAWMLASCLRYPEASELVSEAIEEFEAENMRPSPFYHAARVVSAKCLFSASSVRGTRRAIQTLATLEGRALSWAMLAVRFDTAAEAYSARGAFEEAIRHCEAAESAAAKVGRKLLRLLKFNRCRVLLLSGDAGAALASLAEFSEFTPLNDANEMLLVSAIERELGNASKAEHWLASAIQVIETFQLQAAFSKGVEPRWNVPPLSVLCDTF